MLYSQIIAVCSQIHTKHINTLCGQNVELVNVKLAVHIVTAGLYRVNQKCNIFFNFTCNLMGFLIYLMACILAPCDWSVTEVWRTGKEAAVVCSKSCPCPDVCQVRQRCSNWTAAKNGSMSWLAWQILWIWRDSELVTDSTSVTFGEWNGAKWTELQHSKLTTLVGRCH
jgi:hypothetical protein